jgi:hypothetical protein
MHRRPPGGFPRSFLVRTESRGARIWRSRNLGGFFRDAGLTFGIKGSQKVLKLQPLIAAVADARLYFAAPALATIKL